MASTKKPVVRRKAVRKDDFINVRCTSEQKATMTEAAAQAGLGLSPWLVMLGLKAARDMAKGK